MTTCVCLCICECNQAHPLNLLHFLHRVYWDVHEIKMLLYRCFHLPCIKTPLSETANVLPNTNFKLELMPSQTIHLVSHLYHFHIFYCIISNVSTQTVRMLMFLSGKYYGIKCIRFNNINSVQPEQCKNGRCWTGCHPGQSPFNWMAK